MNALPRLTAPFVCSLCRGCGVVPDPFGDDRPVPCNCTTTEEPTLDDYDLLESMRTLVERLRERNRDHDARIAELVAAAERAASLIQSDSEGSCGIMGTAASVHADLTAAIRRAKGGAQ